MRTAPVSTVGRALRRRMWLVLVITLAGAAAGYQAAAVRPPVYEASTLVSIDESQAASQGVDVAMQADQFLTQRFIALGSSRQVLQAVCAKEGHGCDPTALGRQVRITTPKATAQLQVLADSPSPVTAARLANELADALIARNRAQVEEELGSERTYLQDQLKQQGDQLNLTLQQVAAHATAALPDATVLMTQLTFLQTEYASTFQRLQDLDLQRTQRANELSVEQRASPPRTPIDPDPLRYVGVGLAGGLVAGLLAALLTGGMRNRIKRSSDLAEAAGTDTVVDFTRDLLRGAGRPYAYLARISLGEPDGHSPSLLLVGSTLGERVNDVGLELANAVAASGRRVLVLLAPTPNGVGWLRRRGERPSKVVVEPDGSDGQPVRRSGDEVDLVIHCSLPPMLDPSATWLRSTPETAILVASKGLTRYGEVRRTVDMLDRTGVQVIAAILLPLRMRPAPLTPVLHRPLREPSAAAAVEPPPPATSEPSTTVAAALDR
jgi:capsular polysaccharide biosynthesis protein